MPLLDSPPEVVQRFHALGMSVTRVEAVALGPSRDTAPLHPQMGGFLTMCLNGLASCLERKDPTGRIARDAACIEQFLCSGLPYMGVAYGAGPQAAELSDAAARLLRAVAGLDLLCAGELAARRNSWHGNDANAANKTLLELLNELPSLKGLRSSLSARKTESGTWVRDEVPVSEHYLGLMRVLEKSGAGQNRIISIENLERRLREQFAYREARTARVGSTRIPERIDDVGGYLQAESTQEEVELWVELQQLWRDDPLKMRVAELLRDGVSVRDLAKHGGWGNANPDSVCRAIHRDLQKRRN